ncbi:carboxypeptidase-like regulatory domain-containing protein [uncultured Lacinutrix sp.]|uniref:alpha-2-macroglobulin family protein n=1 Tax=uncultured Lacinutrix sp. TaxID=574032 RepID=UPI002633F58C|nr:carboxypeptidase-like regulatory domain-containing protein [uncultured Lacinutrix sp.]
MNKFLSILMIILFANTALSQNNNYSELWSQVEKLEVEGLPKSALEIVETIELKAKKDNNSPQQIKVLLFKSKFALLLEENAQLKIINDFKAEISKSESPTKNVLQNVLATLYWQYFQQNRYKFYNRTKTKDKVDTKDFRTWDLETLFEEIHFHYKSSLNNGLILQQTKLVDFDILLSLQNESKRYRPTLFDFLAHNALVFYKHQENRINKPAYKFLIDNPEFLGESETFSKLKIVSKDTSSLALNALKLYQELTKFHAKDKEPYALTAVNIDRLDFVNQYATFNDKENVFINTIKSESKKHEEHEVSALYNFKLAGLYNNLGGQYNYETKPEVRWKIKEAIAVCDTTITKFPLSKGAEQCRVLKQYITNPTLQLTAEKLIPVNTESRILVTYKNLEALNLSAYKLTEKQYKKFKKLYRENEQQDFIAKLDPTKNWDTSLKNENDFQLHTTEISLPALNNGRYIITAKTAALDENFKAHTLVQITNIALVEYEDSEKKYFQFIDRNNGNPIENTKIQFQYLYDNEVSETFTTTTSSKGKTFIKKRKRDRRRLNITVLSKDDVAHFDDIYIYNYYRNRNNDNKTRYNAFLFTDRSIYRPGQTVYFKGISMKTKDNKSEVIPNRSVTVVLNNVNGEKVKELNLKTNEYGSVAGEFILPNSGLTGNFSIRLNDNKDLSAYTNISVEEYKRPKFETNFKPITETIKVNDSITVKGEALAFAGSTISDAKVVYRVKRNVEYPRWFYWRRPTFRDQGQEITQGETVTDANGNYNITFKAIPDESVDKSSLPVFKYEITADVTDINGETRSTKTIVNVGYHALTATISIDNALDKTKKDHKITIDTRNLNGEFVPAKGTLKIYKLNAPDNVLRPRPWKAPDYINFTKTDFKNRFPHDAYTNEDKSEHKEKGELVYDKTFNTEVSKELDLKNIKRWESGEYIIVLDSKDKFGQAVKDEAKTTLYSAKDELLADNQLFSITTNKMQYETNDTAEIILATAAKDLTVTIAVEKNNEIINTYIVNLKANKKTIRIPVTKEDLGGFAVHYSFAAYNSFKNGTLQINVPYPKTDLEIETLTFRDKLQPGSDETWKFKIKGPKGDKASAELLASMYDASLDEFKTHNWSFNPIYRSTYYSSLSRNANRSFGQANFSVKRNRLYPSYPKEQMYDQLNWFGFSLNNNRWQYQRYLRGIRINNTKSRYDKSVKSGTVSGIIYDENNSPLPGVNIIVKGTTTGTVTDINGRFSLKVLKGEVLDISMIGFKTESITIDKNNSFSIYLAEDNNSLDEIVVEAMESEAPMAMMVSDESRSKRKTNAGFAQTLEGQVAGLNITTSNVQPGANNKITLKGVSSLSDNKDVLYVVDGVPMTAGEITNINQNDILSMNVLKGNEAIAAYGEKGKNGVVIITTKNNPNANFDTVKIRKNLQETAFFFPQLETDSNGNVLFSFTTPEALTKWKLQLLAHTKTLEHATTSLTTVTQKELMVLPNAPRFLREGDNIKISTKISNLTDKKLSGVAILQLFNALTGKAIDQKLSNAYNDLGFTVDAKGNTSVTWNIDVTDDVQAVQYKIIAKSGDYSDGEQNALPVLTNRMLVTESLPMWIRSNQTKTFTLDKLKTNTSTTLKNHKLTLEMTSNPAWYAVQALPYLMEYPYECNEQTFSRYYANTLASHIANSNPRIQDVFNQWKNTDALLSNLEKNQELKSILIQETPWLRDAQSETEQKKRIALLFDLNKMNNELSKAKNKLKRNQMSNGAWSWFGDYRANRYITQHIITGFGHLKQLNVKLSDIENTMINKALPYLDTQFIKEYKDIRKYDEKADLNLDRLSYTQLHYLYMRSFFPENKPNKEVKEIMDYYHSQIKNYWTKRALYAKGMMALVTHRMNDNSTSSKILKSLKENSITSEELGMYWKENTNSWYWYQAPIETQALMIEAFSEIENDTKTIDELKIWLLKNKQTNRWKTTKATTEAIYALLLQGSDWLSVTDMVEVVIGNQPIAPSKLEAVKVEAGTGYYKTNWTGTEITPAMSEIKITKTGKGIAWGSLYWQYFEDLDKITSAETPLKLKKKLFKKTNTDKGEVITDITKNTKLEVGDLVRVRIELRSDRAMEFVHMKDMRAAGLEPINVISRYKTQDGLGYYEATKDASTNFFFDYLPKGVYVFEYDLRVSNAGNMSNGITTIQSMYAPEFSSHSEGTRITVE